MFSQSEPINAEQKVGCSYLKMGKGLHTQVLKVIDIKSLASHCYGFESLQGLWILSCEETIQPAYGMMVYHVATCA